MLVALGRVEEERAELETELARYRECDPDIIQEVRDLSTTAREAANRWTGMPHSLKMLLIFFLYIN